MQEKSLLKALHVTPEMELYAELQKRSFFHFEKIQIENYSGQNILETQQDMIYFPFCGT